MSHATRTAGTGCLLALAFLALWSLANAQNRILDGYETTIEDFPFQLGLEGGGRHLCGASILTSDWALTAAHCVYNEPLKWLSLRAGSSTREKGGTVHRVKYYVYHDDYRRDTLDYDVAVIRVKDPFKITASTIPVALPMKAPKLGDPVSVTGWGFLQNQQLKKPKQLMVVDIFILSYEDCKKVYPNNLSPRMMCAGDGFKDICNGDSGGPMIRGTREQVGISSWNFKCGDGLPSIYTNITAMTPWIRKATGLYESTDYIVFPY